MAAEKQSRPNIIWIYADDHAYQAISAYDARFREIAPTPNIDRLAASGTLFTNAHCAAPACNPSRTAIMTGVSPPRSGLYANGQKMREILPDAVLFPKYFANPGYWAGGSGQSLHYFLRASSRHSYHPGK